MESLDEIEIDLIFIRPLNFNMKKLKISILFCFFLASYDIIAQDSIQVPRVIDKTSFGIGGGLDYGGIGANLLVYTNKNFGLFGGMGYALTGIGFNAGAKFRFISKKNNTDPYILAMYGYNAAIKIQNESQYNKLFYGPSFGFGLDIRSKLMNKSYLTMALLVPIRGSTVNEYIDDLKSNHGVEFKTKLTPIMFSIGYRFVIN